MKKILLVIGLALLSVSAYSQLKVATYNIRLDKDSDRKNGNGWEKRAPKICDIVKYHDFDHIFVSEGFDVHSYAVLTDTYRDTFDGRHITLPNFPSEIKFTKSIIRFPSDHYPVAVELK